MDETRFDGIARRLGRVTSRRGVLRCAAALAGLHLAEGSAKRRTRRGRKRVNGARAATVGAQRQLSTCGGGGGGGGGGGDGGDGGAPPPPIPCSNTCRDCSAKPLRRGANLSGCDLSGRDLAGIRLNGANLSNACLQCANLEGAQLRGTNLDKACLCQVNLKNADLRGARVSTAQLDCAARTCGTILPNNRPAVTCEPGTSCCAGDCTDTSTSSEHCGRCGNPCGINAVCCGGRCVSRCGSSEVFDAASCSCKPVVCDPPCQPGDVCRPFGCGPDGCGVGICCQVGTSDSGCAFFGCPSGTCAFFQCALNCGSVGSGFNDIIPCAEAQPCASDAECGTGATCRASSCCGGSICVPVCDGSRF
jgi:hypothetical protein